MCSKGDAYIKSSTLHHKERDICDIKACLVYVKTFTLPDLHCKYLSHSPTLTPVCVFVCMFMPVCLCALPGFPYWHIRWTDVYIECLLQFPSLEHFGTRTLTWNLTFWIDCLDSRLPGFSCLCLPNPIPEPWLHEQAVTKFYMGTGNLTSGHHVCATNTLPNEPYPHLWNLSWENDRLSNNQT